MQRVKFKVPTKEKRRGAKWGEYTVGSLKERGYGQGLLVLNMWAGFSSSVGVQFAQSSSQWEARANT
jgi:hypothetical protein